MTLKKPSHPFLGWIVLDIDGTITLDKYSTPEPVVAFLHKKREEGWRIAIATGRPLRFAVLALSKFDFPYLLLPQNGSAVLEMPAKRCLFKRYLPKSSLREVELAFEGIAGDPIIYSGYEREDRVYWRPARFDEEQMRYLQALWQRQKEKTMEIHSFQDIEQESFPLVKCFGRIHEMQLLKERLLKSGQFNVAHIRDPFESDYHILLVTDREASKGQSMEEVIELLGERGTVIGAGDDENDASLLEMADIAIAMAHAPERLQQMADFIAPPTSELGIIHAIELALRKNGHS